MAATHKNAKHTEVLSGATWHAANNERGAKTQARVYEGSGHRVKVGQRGKKWGCWVWPKHAKNCKRKNPASAAHEMREAFTGLPSTKEIVVTESHHVHTHLAALGELIELKVKTIKNQVFTIGFEKQNPKKDVISKLGKKTKGWFDRRGKALTGTIKYLTNAWINKRQSNPKGEVILAVSEDGKNLFCIGGKQTLDLKALGLGELEDKEQVVVGQITNITYHVRKKFDGKEEEHDYVHRLSEESGGPKPYLRYSTRDKKIHIDGGVFKIEKPWNGSTSPGLED